jgi:L-alanine-DL-glutamate epimerase-like enolase superfamily enzyme
MEQSAISKIQLYKLRIPLKQPFVISLGTIYQVENVIVIIETEDGFTGHGECSPYMTINGESIDTCFIVGQYFARVLKGKNALDPEDCMREMDGVIYGNSSIKSAFDIALHDVAAQKTCLPLYKYLGRKK